MDKQTYAKLTRQARNNVTKNMKTVMKKQAEIYQKASADLAEHISHLAPSEMNVDTIDMITQLDKLSTNITESLNTTIEGSIKFSTEESFKVTRKHLSDYGITGQAIDTMYQSVSDGVVSATINRVYQDGYTFSQRLWLEGQRTQVNIKNLLNAGLSEGKDPIKIAKDIQVYTKDGKQILLKSYRNMKAETKEFMRRIPENVDYRAMRIVKTETYNSLRDAEVLGAETDPSTTGLFDWIRAGGAADWGCICPDLVAGSPYTKDEIPTNPHPNCSCYIQAQLRNHDDFVRDLKAWGEGENVGYIDTWASKYGYSR